MDYFKKNKYTVLVIVVLALLNIASISFILFSPIRHEFSVHKEPVDKFIERELHFSDVQKEQYAELRKHMFQHGDSMMALQAATMDELFRFIQRDTVKPEDVRQKALLLGSFETDRSIGLVEHFHALRALCNPEQQQKFDLIIIDVLNHIRDERKLPKPPNEHLK
jgi:hypothetical protein